MKYYIAITSSYNTVMRDLSNMQLCPQACGPQASGMYISGKSLLPLLHLVHSEDSDSLLQQASVFFVGPYSGMVYWRIENREHVLATCIVIGFAVS